MARYLTVSELVEKCGPRGFFDADTDEERRRVWLRRVRHWSTMDILPSAPASRDGTGHHRRYDEETVYLAAVLLRIADLGISIGITRDVALSLQGKGNFSGVGEHLDKCWQLAKADNSGRDYYLCVWITYQGFVYVEGIGPDQGLGSLTTLIDPEDAPVVVLSLTQIFMMIRR